MFSSSSCNGAFIICVLLLPPCSVALGKRRLLHLLYSHLILPLV
uniref:Uncharacterized protein n=1 Tax=Anguilla anguilla TaxID=7936 RepID=A0A0E9S6V4_ANGAN